MPPTVMRSESGFSRRSRKGTGLFERMLQAFSRRDHRSREPPYGIDEALVIGLR